MWIHTTTEQLPLGLSSSSAISKVTVGCDGPPSVYVLNPSCTVVSWPHLDVICLLTTLAPSGSFALNFLIHYGFQWIVTSFDVTKVAFFFVIMLFSSVPAILSSSSSILSSPIVAFSLNQLMPSHPSCCYLLQLLPCPAQLYYIVCVYVPAPLTHSIPSLPSVC